MKKKLTKYDFTECLLVEWAQVIGYHQNGKKGEGVSVGFICAFEEVKHELENLYGKGHYGAVKFKSIESSEVLPESLTKKILSAEIEFEKSIKSKEDKYNGYFYSGCLVYMIDGKKVFGKSIHKICKEKGKGNLEEALKDYNPDKEIDNVFKGYPPPYSAPGFGR